LISESANQKNRHWKVAVSVLLVAILLLGAVAVYQQERISSLDRQLGAGTAVIGGVRYWEMPFPASAPNGTSVTFHGVNFTSLSPFSLSNSYSDPSKYIFFGSVWLSNGTLLNLTGKTVEIGYHFRFPTLSTIQYGIPSSTGAPPTSMLIAFPGGEREVYYGWTVTASNLPSSQNIPYPHVFLNETNLSDVANPWFSEHTGPQAGVLYMGNGLTFYVSAN